MLVLGMETSIERLHCKTGGMQCIFTEMVVFYLMRLYGKATVLRVKVYMKLHHITYTVIHNLKGEEL
jgi:hypothetical protein